MFGLRTVLDGVYSFFSESEHDESNDKKPSLPCAEDSSIGHHDADDKDDLQEKLPDAEARVLQLENQVKELRSENLKNKSDIEILRHNQEMAKQLEISFPDLLKWLQKMLGKSLCEENSADTGELVSLLSANGLIVDKDYEPGQEGFICVKDKYVAEPTVSFPLITRGDDIILEGIVKVPLSFAGAEPPVEQTKTEINNGDSSGNNQMGASTAAAEALISDDDDFRVNLK